MTHTYKTKDYEKRPMQNWNVAYRKISMMENGSDGSAVSVLNEDESEGRMFTKWELCKIVKELRKYRRFRMALEVFISYILIKRIVFNFKGSHLLCCGFCLALIGMRLYVNVLVKLLGDLFHIGRLYVLYQ